MFDSIFNWVGSLLEGLFSPFELLAKGIVDIANFMVNIVDYINPFSEKFLLSGLMNFLSTSLSYINPFDDNFILKGVLDFLSNIISYLNPFSENFFGNKIVEGFSELLKTLFVPSNNNFSDLESKFKEKFAFVEQIKTLFSSFLGFSDYGNSVPSFMISFNGNTLAIIDFSMFLEYRGWLHGIILSIAWFVFIRRQLNRLPSVIGGFGQ